MASLFDSLAPLFVQVTGDDVPVSYTHATATTDVLGIFEVPALIVQGLADGADIVDADASFHCAEADLPAGYGEGDTILRRGTTYVVKAPMPDGHGMVRLPLFKRS
ncbi:head-tail joining protein [Reyranella sp.]|uniref:head-tail joining protein n=1 Tax=Reyranella sp. TaxID=1929291 RepID=UPI003D09D35D